MTLAQFLQTCRKAMGDESPASIAYYWNDFSEESLYECEDANFKIDLDNQILMLEGEVFPLNVVGTVNDDGIFIFSHGDNRIGIQPWF